MADMTPALNSLRALTDLEEGWVDGDAGKTPMAGTVALAGQLIDVAAALGVSVPAVFPTEDGGVQLAFGEHGALTVDVEPGGGVYIHVADTAQGRYTAVSVPSLKLDDRPRPVADHTLCAICTHANYAHCPRNACRAIVGKDGNDFVMCDCKEAT